MHTLHNVEYHNIKEEVQSWFSGYSEGTVEVHTKGGLVVICHFRKVVEVTVERPFNFSPDYLDGQIGDCKMVLSRYGGKARVYRPDGSVREFTVDPNCEDDELWFRATEAYKSLPD